MTITEKLENTSIQEKKDSFLDKSVININYQSEHSIIILTLNLGEQIHGKCLWKFNNLLLYDTDLLKCINKKTGEVKIQYCLSMYNTLKIKNVGDKDLQFSKNDQ